MHGSVVVEEDALAPEGAVGVYLVEGGEVGFVRSAPDRLLPPEDGEAKAEAEEGDLFIGRDGVGPLDAPEGGGELGEVPLDVLDSKGRTFWDGGVIFYFGDLAHDVGTLKYVLGDQGGLLLDRIVARVSQKIFGRFFAKGGGTGDHLVVENALGSHLEGATGENQTSDFLPLRMAFPALASEY